MEKSSWSLDAIGSSTLAIDDGMEDCRIFFFLKYRRVYFLGHTCCFAGVSGRLGNGIGARRIMMRFPLQVAYK